MKVRFWGVRGSHPTPVTPDEIRRKIAAVVRRVRPYDLKNADSRERFLARLPEWLFGTTGGNTPCVECLLSDDTMLVFGAGTGIQRLSTALRASKQRRKVFHIFFSHFHYDHVQGLPFFVPAYIPDTELHFYSPIPELEQILRKHMVHPFFPIRMEDKMTKRMHFHVFSEPEIQIGSARIQTHELNHPGRAFAYKVTEGERSFVYCTDTELSSEDFEMNTLNRNMFHGADVLVLDTMYTLGEAIEKYSWGHSSFSLGVEFATTWQVKALYLFHHEPLYDDKKLDHNLTAARWYANRLGNSGLSIELAREGDSIHL